MKKNLHNSKKGNIFAISNERKGTLKVKQFKEKKYENF